LSCVMTSSKDKEPFSAYRSSWAASIGPCSAVPWTIGSCRGETMVSSPFLGGYKSTYVVFDIVEVMKSPSPRDCARPRRRDPPLSRRGARRSVDAALITSRTRRRLPVLLRPTTGVRRFGRPHRPGRLHGRDRRG